MPSWVNLCFLDMMFTPGQVSSGLAEIHVFGVPGYQKMNGEFVVSPNVQQFLRRFIVDILFSQSALISRCPFRKMNLWLYDSNISDTDRGYAIPRLTADTFKIEAELEETRLKNIQILRKAAGKSRDLASKIQQWEIAVETLLRSLFVEFIEMPLVPLYFIKNPTFENERRPVSAMDLSPSMSQGLIFDAIIVETLD